MDANENAELMLEVFRAIEQRDAQRVFNRGLFSVSTTTASPPLSRSLGYGDRRVEAARCADHNTGIGRIAEGST
jgi:hypothetical protein